MQNRPFSPHRFDTALKEVLHKHFKRMEINGTFPDKTKKQWLFAQ